MHTEAAFNTAHFASILAQARGVSFLAPTPPAPLIFNNSVLWHRPGEWEHFVYHTRYTYTGGGFIELWRNGKRLVSLADTGTAYNDDQGPYFKFGIYAASWGTMASPPPANSSSNAVVIGGLKQARPAANTSRPALCGAHS